MNVLVVAAHGLHCHWLGPYGNVWVATPAADALAAESVVFDCHVAADPTPAGCRANCPPSLVARLRAARISTALVDDRQARTVDDRPWQYVLPTEPDRHPTPGEALLEAVRAAFSREPGLLWIETDRLLPPWDLELETYQHYATTSGGFAAEAEAVEPTDDPTPGHFDPNDDREWHRLHNSFAAAVTAFDVELGELVREFRTRGLDRSTALLITSGYGYPLGEHGIVGPTGSRMHEELVHVPLMIRLPGQHQAMRRVSAFTQTTDLGPTVCDLLGLTPPADLPGASLIPLAMGTAESSRHAARSAHGEERALRTADWAFLPGHPPRLYRKPDDTWEVNDLAPRHPDECDRLAAELDEGPTP